MRLSDKRIKQLQTLLKEQFDLDCTPEQAQEAGLAVIRFVLAKTQRQRYLMNNKKEMNYEK